MSYTGILVKDFIEGINADTIGWFLPAIQRPITSDINNFKHSCATSRPMEILRHK